MKRKEKICIVGLGYVGLPLAVAFSRKGYKVSGFDINKKRVAELQRGVDSTNSVKEKELKALKIRFSNDTGVIRDADMIIITVPTPITRFNTPNLKALKAATKTVAMNMKPGVVVVYESTVYPGVTEEVCLPILKRYSGREYKKDFFIAYSPERISPGEKNRVEEIKKIVSADDEETLRRVAGVYSSVIRAGVYKAPSIKVAEAAKIIENIQRDVNIAIINELALICDRLGIDTSDVIDAASTKWNFHRYTPGAVGGHCIGVDPYYLTFKAKKLGYKTRVIAAGRAVNNSMAYHIAEKVAEMIKGAGKKLREAKAVILGVTFKENVPDTRNSKALIIIQQLKRRKVKVYVHDPLLPAVIRSDGFNIRNTQFRELKDMDAAIMFSPHRQFSQLTLRKLRERMSEKPVLFDVKGFYSKEEAGQMGFEYKRL